MAQWIWINKIPIDINLLRDIVEEYKLNDYLQTAPSLKMEKTTESINEKTKKVRTSFVFGGVEC